MRLPFRTTAALLAILATVTAPSDIAGAADRPPLSAARTWDYQLQDYDLDRLAASPADLLVIDHSRNGTAPGIFSLDEIARLKQRPDGSRRLVISYFSIGEAEEYRFYWRPEWKANPPDWLHSENCRWPRNHLVRYWLPGWKEIIFAGPDAYLARIIAAGFDGVYLDRIDAYLDLNRDYPDARPSMKAFVAELAETARRRAPGFLIIAQNAEDLLVSPEYRAAIDGLAKEDLLYGVTGTGVRNDKAMIAGSLDYIKALAKDGKPVFGVEYLTSTAQIEETRRELAGLGVVPVFPTRALDGRDPVATAPNPSLPAVNAEIGTPEYGAAHCKP